MKLINYSFSTSGRRESLDMAIDFEVTDALEKLRRMGILSVDCDDEDCKVLVSPESLGFTFNQP